MTIADVLGSTRFKLLRRIGQGGMGVVYEAFDEQHQATVALKMLSHVGAEDLYDLKREFRLLADVGHHNLVTLYELFVEDVRCYFTMELVKGVDLLSYVRSGARVAYDDTVKVPAEGAYAVRAPSAHDSPFDETRLRNCLRQLASGIAAIHQAGKLHCDLKPSNVLVTDDGRVVILDFGLATDQNPSSMYERARFGGTPAYMAPEQGMYGITSRASDWYALGAMLYEALTGALPFSGHPARVLAQKAERAAPKPSTVVGWVPPDLDVLCSALLERRPEDRPDSVQLFSALQLQEARSAEPYSQIPANDDQPFVNRKEQLERLVAAFGVALRGNTVVAVVQGTSGIGKSALVSQFLRPRSEEAIILRGRCYESESVPFKALDAVIDALCMHVLSPRFADLQSILPADMAALVRLFPVLRRIPGAPLVDAVDDDEPRARRRRAVSVLKELLRLLAAVSPLLMFIDDLQWGDEDSAQLLAELLSTSAGFPWLFIGAYRSDEAPNSAFLRTFFEAVPSARIHDIAVGPLDEHDARILARRLMVAHGANDGNRVAAIASESGGSPFFIVELSNHEMDAELDGRRREVSLDGALLRRIESFSPPARALLEVCCVAGRPIDERIAFAASELKEPYAALAALKAGRLIRSSSTGKHVEPYHDRIRQSVAACLSKERAQAWHFRLAQVLERHPDADPELLAQHFERGGRPDRARTYAREAAVRAARTLAFDQSARLYRFCLSLVSEEHEERRELLRGLGEALSSAGRGREAAEAFLQASAGASAAETSDLRRRAAEQLLRSGFLDRGMDVLREALSEVGISMPASDDELRKMSRELSGKLRERGLSFDPRQSDAVLPSSLRRIEVFWSAALGLATIDGARAELMAFHHLLDALDSGDARLVLRGLALHIVTSGARPGSRRVASILDQIDQIAGALGDADALGWSHYARGVADFWQGRPRSCLSNIGRAESYWRSTPGGRARELSMARMAMHLSLTLIGAISDLRARTPVWLSEAKDRDDLYLSTLLSAYSWTESIAADDPGRSLEDATQAVQRWGRQHFDLIRWETLITRVQVALYRGDAPAAWADLSASWDAILTSNIGMATQFRALSFDARGRTSLAMAARGDDSAPWLEYVELAATELESLGLPCFEAHPLLLRAGAAALRGDRAGAENALRDVETRSLAHEGNPLTALAARYQRCRLTEGDEDELRAAARALTAAGVVDVDAWTAVYVPGFTGGRWKETPRV
ncbi:MAG TPA: protein kinase [Polyangiaceae bacterium]|nr:protein kinase [Polyangiaceae bacterium]